LDDEEWEEWQDVASEEFEDTFHMMSCSPVHPETSSADASTRRRGSLISALYCVSSIHMSPIKIAFVINKLLLIKQAIRAKV